MRNFINARSRVIVNNNRLMNIPLVDECGHARVQKQQLRHVTEY
jgi:hypothetical protein